MDVFILILEDVVGKIGVSVMQHSFFVTAHCLALAHFPEVYGCKDRETVRDVNRIPRQSCGNSPMQRRLKV